MVSIQKTLPKAEFVVPPSFVSLLIIRTPTQEVWNTNCACLLQVGIGTTYRPEGVCRTVKLLTKKGLPKNDPKVEKWSLNFAYNTQDAEV